MMWADICTPLVEKSALLGKTATHDPDHTGAITGVASVSGLITA